MRKCIIIITHFLLCFHIFFFLISHFVSYPCSLLLNKSTDTHRLLLKHVLIMFCFVMSVNKGREEVLYILCTSKIKGYFFVFTQKCKYKFYCLLCSLKYQLIPHLFYIPTLYKNGIHVPVYTLNTHI